MFVRNSIVGSIIAAAYVGPVRAGDHYNVLDQIGSSPTQLAGSASSSQYQPGNPNGVFATIDNFIVGDEENHSPVRLTQFEAVVTGLQNFVSFDLIRTWNVQVFSSLDAAAAAATGDVYSASFDEPVFLTSGYSALGEIATFEIDVVLNPGEYWIGLTMENLGSENGTVGIRHSQIGDGPCQFAVPSFNDTFPLAGPAAYRLEGIDVPGPGALIVLVVSGMLGARTRHRWNGYRP